jgi:glycosyltransferase involved in cell wall biosynthesis
MNVAISVVRPFHCGLMANALLKHVDSVSIYSSAPRRFFRRLDEQVATHFVPAPIELLPYTLFRHNIVLWDRLVALALPKRAPKIDVVVGLATGALSVGEQAHRRGSRFVLDRACPHVDFQQQLVKEENEKVGAPFEAEPSWFRERQIAEYETADAILVPSRYTAQTFPAYLQPKLVLAPLLGRAKAAGAIQLERNTPFTVGVLGGNPVRKGYLYLLKAWQRLALPNAKLLIRSSSDFSMFPVLAELLKQNPSVEIIEYVPDISEFYRRCDLFVLPSMDDGFGMALFEAMANGVPTISTRNCGASELLTDGQDGLIIDAGSEDQLAEAIERLYDDEPLRQAVALAGQQTAMRIAASTLYEDALRQILVA